MDVVPRRGDLVLAAAQVLYSLRTSQAGRGQAGCLLRGLLAVTTTGLPPVSS